MKLLMIVFALSSGAVAMAAETHENFESFRGKPALTYMRSIQDWHVAENCRGGIWGRRRTSLRNSSNGKITVCRKEHKKMVCISSWKSENGSPRGLGLRDLYLKLTNDDCVLK